MSSTEKKATPEQIATLRMLSEQWDMLTKKFGELHYQKKLVDQELVEVDGLLDALEGQRRTIVTELQEKFGSTGTIDLTTGDFKPDAE